MAAIKSFDVSREGKDLRIRMQAGDMTVGRLSRAFQVESNSLYLKEEFGDMAYWPNDGGRFNVMHLTDGTSLQVMGEGLRADLPQTDVSRQLQHSHQGPVFSGFSYTGSRAGPMPFAANYRAPLFAGNTKKNKAIAKVILAEGNKTDKGGTSFRELGQTYVNITEDTANVQYITSKVRETCGDQRLELFTSNGLKVNDTDGTRGLSFWKCGARKIFAVANIADTRMPSKRASKSKAMFAMNQASDVSDGSDDDFVPKKFKAAEKDQDIHKMKGDIIDVKCMVTEMLEVNKSLPLPLGITKLVKEAFQCKICRDTPMKPPIIATKCCSSLLGCDECVNTWYDGVNGLAKKCPHCNEPRGYAFTFQFKGLDDFLTGMRKVLITRSEDDNLAD